MRGSVVLDRIIDGLAGVLTALLVVLERNMAALYRRQSVISAQG